MKSTRRLLITGILLCRLFCIKGQELPRRQIEELRAVTTNPDDSIKMVGFLDLGRYFLDLNNDSAIFYAHKARLLSVQIKSKDFEGQCYDFLGAVELNRGNFDQSIGYLQKAQKIFEDQGDSTGLIVNNVNIGRVYKSQHDFIRAKEYYSHALHIIPRWSRDSVFLSWALMDFGDLMMMENKPDSALYYSRLSYEVVMRVISPFAGKYLPIALNTMGTIYQHSGQYDSALEKYRQAVSVASDNFNWQAVADNYMSIAILYKTTHQIDSGFYYAKKALALARQVKSPLAIETSSSYLKDYFKDKKLFDSAFVYQEIMVQAKDSLVNLEKIRQVQNFAFNERLKQEEIKAQVVEVRNNARMYILIAGLTALVVIALILLRNMRQSTKAKRKIETAYQQLKSTQSRLIHAEKMASLGEMTAGIAHEIQNPLNFVNNFSEVNVELSEELKDEFNKADLPADVKSNLEPLIETILGNQEKIVHHGKRADSIVKSMLAHSRTSTGQKASTDINALVEEWLRLSYNGMRAKEKSFQCAMRTDYDQGAGKIDIVPQDIGRVLLNLFNNAFYAVYERKKGNEAGYDPMVFVSTKRNGGRLFIKVRDNGSGIPEKVVDKIFQPFFTTKPTGQGTGLGLSLSYDIVKAHGGDINVETSEGEYTQFEVEIPMV
jgi:signal transduction histidine kinase